MKLQIIESFFISKSGLKSDSEDIIHVDENFIAVIDGNTAKSRSKIRGKSPGRLAAEIIDKAFYDLPKLATARQAVDHFTQQISRYYSKERLSSAIKKKPELVASAVFAAISAERRELWIVGDCQALLGKRRLQHFKKIDKTLAETRAIILTLELLQEKTIRQLMNRDPGREFIKPILTRQSLFQNKQSEEFWYPAIDGFPVPTKGIKIYPIPSSTNTIVIAIDGYPFLRKTLEASEMELGKLLREDPLFFRQFKSTKGLVNGDKSFDDRAYVRVKLVK